MPRDQANGGDSSMKRVHLIRGLAVSLTLWQGFALGVSAEGLSYADNQIFPHGYVDIDKAGPLSVTDYPFAAIGRKIVFQASYRSLYGLKELTDSRAALAVSCGDFAVGTAAAVFGQSDYFQQIGLSSFASFKHRRSAVGISAIYHQYAFNSHYVPISYVTANAGLSLTCWKLTFFGVGRSLNQPRYYAGGATVLPEGEAGLSFKSRDGLDSQAKVLFVRYQKLTGELSQSLQMVPYASVNWALVLSPVRLGVGLALEKKSFGFEYKFSHHPLLGSTHSVILAFSAK